MSPTQSDNWQTVSQFVSDLRNVSRLAAYVDTVVDVYESGAWRAYTDATGRSDRWREAEFDYFLIACGAQYGEVQRLLTWDRARAVELASAMESEDPKNRRSLGEVRPSGPHQRGRRWSSSPSARAGPRATASSESARRHNALEPGRGPG